MPQILLKELQVWCFNGVDCAMNGCCFRFFVGWFTTGCWLTWINRCNMLEIEEKVLPLHYYRRLNISAGIVCFGWHPLESVIL